MVDQASPTLDSADADNQASEPVATAELAEPVAADEPPTEEPSTPVDSELLGELARAMHQAATSQYERLNAELERRRSEQVEAIATRAAADVEQLKAASESDIGAIDAWAKAEAEKIKQERLRRIEDRRLRLTAQLEQEASVKDREISAIEAAIDAHRLEVDRFFGRMERETDPAAIARVAATMPAFPALAEIAEAARTEAGAPLATSAATPAALELDAEASVSQSRLMAVMDPESLRGAADEAIAQPWEAPYAVSVAAGSIATEESAETPAAAEHPSGVGSTLLRTVRAIRPMSGERRDRSGDDG